MKKPLVSVVVPAHNEEKYIIPTLKSVLNQTYKSIELIVIDNASFDNTAKIALRYATRVIYEGKKGMAYARNRGISEAKGKIIIKLDADTIIKSDSVERVVRKFEKDKNLVALSGPSVFIEGGVLSRKLSYLFYASVLFINRLIMMHNSLNGVFYALRADVAKKVKTHDNESIYQEDMDMSCHMAVYGKCAIDYLLVSKTSCRRLKNNPFHFFVKYSVKGVRTILKHHPSHKLHKVC